MKKPFIVLLAAALLALTASGAWADTLVYHFDNGTLVQRSDNNAWVDVIGDKTIYQIFGADLFQDASSSYYLRIYTNWDPTNNGYLGTNTADLFINTNPYVDNAWDAAVVLNSARDDSQTVYYAPTITYSFAGVTYGTHYDQNDPKVVPVLGTSSSKSNTTVTWTDTAGPWDYYVDITLTGITGFDPGNFAFLWASATCANDTAEGKVPLPGALVLLGAGMVRLAAYARRRRNQVVR